MYRHQEPTQVQIENEDDLVVGFSCDSCPKSDCQDCPAMLQELDGMELNEGLS